MEAGGRFATDDMNGIVCAAMNELRQLRRAIGLGQRAFAALLSVPLETVRTWDSGRRSIPLNMLQRAKLAATEHTRNSELLSLDQLARELGVHQRTLRAAARTGRLQVTFSSRSAFGRPIRLATRAAGQAFMRKDYRRYGGQSQAAKRPVCRLAAMGGFLSVFSRNTRFFTGNTL